MHRPFFHTIALTCCLLGLAGTIQAGEIVVVPIDLGADEVMISPNHSLQEVFAGEQPWPSILNVQLHLVGSHTCQYAYCAENMPYDVYPTDGAVAFGFEVGGNKVFPTRQGFACVPEGEDFDLTLSFAAGEDPDWSFLADGTGTLFIEHQPTWDPCQMFAVFLGVDATLTSVELLVEVPGWVPVESQTWGTIKARYR